jgi:hypothetical protein
VVLKFLGRFDVVPTERRLRELLRKITSRPMSFRKQSANEFVDAVQTQAKDEGSDNDSWPYAEFPSVSCSLRDIVASVEFYVHGN